MPPKVRHFWGSSTATATETVIKILRQTVEYWFPVPEELPQSPGPRTGALGEFIIFIKKDEDAVEGAY